MRIARATAASSLALPGSTYIYCIKPAGSKLTAISSDDSLRVLDPKTLQLDTQHTFTNIHAGITCLETANFDSESVLTAGRDGFIRCWDLRTGEKTGELKDETSAPFLSLAVAPNGYAIAAGNELTHSQATVQIWDYRSPKVPIVRYVETHNDDVTEVCFHPTQPACLLSGSTDGLVNIYNTTLTDEDECLVQVFNHSSSIHHAGFLDMTTVYAVSHDEQMSIYTISQAAEAEGSSGGDGPVVFGDVRPRLSCEYVVNVLRTDAGAVIAAGSQSASTLDLSPLKLASQWDFDIPETLRLPEAHGGEIIRAIHMNNESNAIFTGGEGGTIVAWRPTRSTGDSRRSGPLRHK